MVLLRVSSKQIHMWILLFPYIQIMNCSNSIVNVIIDCNLGEISAIKIWLKYRMRTFKAEINGNNSLIHLVSRAKVVGNGLYICTRAKAPLSIPSDQALIWAYSRIATSICCLLKTNHGQAAYHPCPTSFHPLHCPCSG